MSSLQVIYSRVTQYLTNELTFSFLCYFLKIATNPNSRQGSPVASLCVDPSGMIKHY